MLKFVKLKMLLKLLNRHVPVGVATNFGEGTPFGNARALRFQMRLEIVVAKTLAAVFALDRVVAARLDVCHQFAKFSVPLATLVGKFAADGQSEDFFSHEAIGKILHDRTITVKNTFAETRYDFHTSFSSSSSGVKGSLQNSRGQQGFLRKKEQITINVKKEKFLLTCFCQ